MEPTVEPTLEPTNKGRIGSYCFAVDDNHGVYPVDHSGNTDDSQRPYQCENAEALPGLGPALSRGSGKSEDRVGEPLVGVTQTRVGSGAICAPVVSGANCAPVESGANCASLGTSANCASLEPGAKCASVESGANCASVDPGANCASVESGANCASEEPDADRTSAAAGRKQTGYPKHPHRNFGCPSMEEFSDLPMGDTTDFTYNIKDVRDIDVHELVKVAQRSMLKDAEAHCERVIKEIRWLQEEDEYIRLWSPVSEVAKRQATVRMKSAGFEMLKDVGYVELLSQFTEIRGLCRLFCVPEYAKKRWRVITHTLSP